MTTTLISATTTPLITGLKMMRRISTTSAKINAGKTTLSALPAAINTKKCLAKYRRPKWTPVL